MSSRHVDRTRNPALTPPRRHSSADSTLSIDRSTLIKLVGGGPASSSDHQDQASHHAQQDKDLIHEGYSTRLYRIRSRRDSLPPECLEAGSDSVLVKVLKVDDPDPSDVGALYNEHDILSGPLKGCAAARSVIGPKTKFDGRPAINLTYVEGSTLREWAKLWARNVHYLARDGGRVGDAVRTAVELVSAVVAVHSAGVVHNDLSVENVIIGATRRQEPQEGGFAGKDGSGGGAAEMGGGRRTVRIIDFGSAVANPTAHSAGDRGRPSGDARGASRSRGARSRSGSRSPMRGASPTVGGGGGGGSSRSRQRKGGHASPGRPRRSDGSPMGRVRSGSFEQRPMSTRSSGCGTSGGGRQLQLQRQRQSGGVSLYPAAVKRDLACLGTLLCKLFTGKPTPQWAEADGLGLVGKTASVRTLGSVDDKEGGGGGESSKRSFRRQEVRRLASTLFPSGVVPPNLTWMILDLLAHSEGSNNKKDGLAGGGAELHIDEESSAGHSSSHTSHDNNNMFHQPSISSSSTSPCYQLSTEVERDLRLMLTDESFLRVPPPANSSDPLGLAASATRRGAEGGRKLYGRAKEEAALREVYRRMRDRPQSGGGGGGGGGAEIVLISGESGTGKTALAQSVARDVVVTDGGFFLTGKFDQIHKTAYSAFIAAFTEYCDKVVDGDEEDLMTIGESIRDSVGSEGKLLSSIIPALEGIIGKQIDDSGEKSGELHTQAYRLKYAFGNFVKAVAVANPEHRVALFLDDLQWADCESLQLIDSLLGNSSFFLIGTYRDDEVSPDHLLLSDMGNATVTRIHISSLLPDSINEMISDMLHLPRQLTRTQLTDIVYKKTYGNALFVIQFLQTLCDEGVLSYSAEDEWWRWDLEGIQSMAITENVVHLLEKKIQRFSDEAQEALKIAACLGSQFGSYPLKLVLNKDVERSLFRAMNDGLVSAVVPGKEYRFTHDKIQQAAYNLVPAGEHAATHLRIGRLLWKNATDEDLEGELLFAIANQLNLGLGISNVKGNAERIDLAQIALKAGKRAMHTSAFAAAATYLSYGINILEGLHWKKPYYGLSHALFNAAAEAEFVNGNFDRMEEYLEQIFCHSRTLLDKLAAHTVCVNALGVRARLQEAVDMGLSVLRQLNEPFPSSKIGTTHVLKGLLKTKWMLRGKSDQDILSLPTMDSPEKVAAMQIMHLLYVYAIVAREDLVPLLVFRMVQMSLKHGLAAASSFGFSSYGAILCVLGKSKEGYRYGLIALAILEKFSAKDMKARVYSCVYSMITIWSDHLERSLPPLLDAHRIGLETGDVEFGCFCANVFCMISFAAGHSLLPLEEQMKSFCESMIDHKQEVCFSVSVPIWQGMLNLIGPSKAPTTLTGEVMDQEEFLQKHTASGNLSAVCGIYYQRLLLACIFGDYVLAVEMAEKSRNIDKNSPGLCVVFNHAFYEGISALALAQDNHNRRKMLKVAKKSIKKMTKWAREAPQNCRHKLLLLTAEKFAAHGDREQAIRMYDQSITAARYEGFLHDQALGSERAAKYLLLCGNTRGATDYAKLAHSLYTEWGARQKADLLYQDFLSHL